MCLLSKINDNDDDDDDDKHVLADILRSRYVARTPSWKPAVKAAAVMLRTPPVDGQSPASQPCPFPIYGAQFENAPRHPPVTGQQRVQTPPSRLFTLRRHIAGWTQACN